LGVRHSFVIQISIFVISSMLPFRFRLATLLRLRESDRDERRSRLADAQRAEDIVGARIEEIDSELWRLRGESARLSRPGLVNVDELMEINRFELLLSAERQAAEQQHKLVAEEVERRRLALVAADREVRVLERLRETGQERHRQEVDRQERKQMDETAMHAFVRKDQ
jgi:flagellar export protein FliJ